MFASDLHANLEALVVLRGARDQLWILGDRFKRHDDLRKMRTVTVDGEKREDVR
jgi:hypothetical protein